LAKAKKFIPDQLQPWIEARRKHHLSHVHVQMARELGMNPKKLGGIDNHRQEPWKQPLPEFIATLYAKRFGKDVPDVVRSIEDTAAAKQAKKQARRAANAAPEVASATDASGRNPHVRNLHWRTRSLQVNVRAMITVELRDAQRALPALADSALRGKAVYITVGPNKLRLAPADAEAPSETAGPRPGRGAWKGRVSIPDAFYESWTAEELGEQEG
jgi:hypothetical protein